MADIGADVTINFNDDEFRKNLEEKKEKALVICGMQAEGYAKIELESDPRRIDTGRLRNSITWATMKEHSEPRFEGGDDADEVDSDSGVTSAQAEQDAVIIGTNVEYAYDIHEGDESRGLAPNRFLRNAVEKHQDEYRKIIDETLREE